MLICLVVFVAGFRHSSVVLIERLICTVGENGRHPATPRPLAGGHHDHTCSTQNGVAGSLGIVVDPSKALVET